MSDFCLECECNHFTPNGECNIGCVEDCPIARVANEIKSKIVEMIFASKEKNHFDGEDIVDIWYMLADACEGCAEITESFLPYLKLADACEEQGAELRVFKNCMEDCEDVFYEQADK